VLAELVAEFEKLTVTELKPINDGAKKLALPELYLPPVKQK